MRGTEMAKRMMRMGIFLTMLAGVLPGRAEAGSFFPAGSGETLAGDVRPDYVYRKERLPSPTDDGFLSSVSDLFNGAEEQPPPPLPAELATELKLKVRELSRQLLEQTVDPFDDDYRVIVSTFVDLNRLYRTSGLGRVIGEQLIGELQRAGIDVVEVRLSPSLQIEQGYGEYSLSRDMLQLSYAHDAQAVVAGTYIIRDGQVMVNARMLNQGDGLVLASAGVVFEENDFVRALVKDEGMPPREGKSVRFRDFGETR